MYSLLFTSGKVAPGTSPPDYFQQPQSVLHFLVAPGIASEYRNSQHLRFPRIDQRQNGLHIRARWPRTILIDDDFAFLLCVRRELETQRQEREYPTA
jgi:hypothetical protein